MLRQDAPPAPPCNLSQRTPASLNFFERIEYSKTNPDGNCAGTAFYISGVCQSQRTIDHPIVVSALKSLKALAIPVQGCLIVWKQASEFSEKYGLDRFVLHVGVVTSTNPLLVTHRLNDGGNFYLNQPIEEINQIYQKMQTKSCPVLISFYLPTALE